MNQEIIPFKNRVVDYTKPVKVYRNLNAKNEEEKYSIQQKGLVVGHTNRLYLFGVEFLIQKSGKKKAIMTGQRNVHAFAKGYLYNVNGLKIDLYKPVKYDSFNEYGFIYEDNGQQIKKAHAAVFTRSGLLVSKPTFYEKPENFI